MRAAYCPGQLASDADSDVSIRPSVQRPMESAQLDNFASVHEASVDGSKNANLSYSHAGLDAWTGRKPESGGEGDSATTEPLPYDPGPIPDCLRRTASSGGHSARTLSDIDAVLEELAARGEQPPSPPRARGWHLTGALAA